MSTPSRFDPRPLAALRAAFDLTAGAAVLHVPADYATIQAAVDAATGGDQVRVAAGTYAENVVIEDKAIDLASESRARATIIDGQDRGSVVRIGWANGTRVSGFTLRNGRAAQGGGVYVVASVATIENCIVTGNAATGEGGGVALIDAGATIRHNRIALNGAERGAGVFLRSRKALLFDNAIEDNGADDLGGGVMVDDGEPTILRNVIRGNDAGLGSGGGIYVDQSSPEVADNLLAGNQAQFGGGIYVDGRGRSQGRWFDNTVADNSGGGNPGSQLRIVDGHRILFANNVFSGSRALHCVDEVNGLSPRFEFNDVDGGADGTCAGTATGGTNLQRDPLFTRGENGHPYHLSPASPLVDAGSNELAAPLRRDLGGRPRIIDGGRGPVVDIGAFEYRPE